MILTLTTHSSGPKGRNKMKKAHCLTLPLVKVMPELVFSVYGSEPQCSHSNSTVPWPRVTDIKDDRVKYNGSFCSARSQKNLPCVDYTLLRKLTVMSGSAVAKSHRYKG
ncbi:hypothetical protein J6590_032274 [Homalodisca vitripennis]|nr:hypothetical protein J6590_032274 [Homalodisca vitripennis]